MPLKNIQQRQHEFEEKCRNIKENFWPQACKDYFNKARETKWREMYSLSFEYKIPYSVDTVWNVIRQAEFFPRWFHIIHEARWYNSKCIMDKFAAGSGFILYENRNNWETISGKGEYPEFITSRAIVDYQKDDYVVIKIPDIYRDRDMKRNTYLKLSVHGYERYSTKIKAEITKYYIPSYSSVIFYHVFGSFGKANEEERIGDASELENGFRRMVKEITDICYDLDHPQINMTDCYWFTSQEYDAGTVHFYPNIDDRKVPYVGHHIKAKERIGYVHRDTVDEEYSKENYSIYSEESGYIAYILKHNGDSLSTKEERFFLVCKTLDALKRVTCDENVQHDKI